MDGNSLKTFGRGLPSGICFSHTSAIIEGGKGTAEGKVQSLQSAGASVVDDPSDLGKVLKKLLLKG